jgi:hypothetical protein
MDELKRGKGIRGLLRHLCFAVFGITALADVTNLFNPVNLIFGAVIGILFGILCRAFFSGVLGAFNKDLKKEHGKKVVSYSVGRGMTYLLPFATIATLATFILGWNVPGGFLSAGLMTSGIASSLELDKLLGKASTKNSITASVVCGTFAAIWTIGIRFAGMIPPYIEGGITLLGSLTGNPL